MWFIGVEVEQETSAPPPNKNPGSAPERSANFSHKSDPKKEKSVVHLHMSRILLAAKQSWTSLCMRRPLNKGSYLQVMWWALGQYILLVCLVFNLLILCFNFIIS